VPLSRTILLAARVPPYNYREALHIALESLGNSLGDVNIDTEEEREIDMR